MSMLGQIMSAVQGSMSASSNMASRGGSASTKEDPNVTGYRKLLENATKPGSDYSPQQISALIQNAPSGVDVTPFTAITGNESPAQKTERKVNADIMNSFAQLLNGGKPAQSQTPEAASYPSAPSSPSIGETMPEAAPEPGAPANIFTPDLVFRTAMKKLSGIDVGGHYIEGPEWFKSYSDRVNSGTPASVAMLDTANEYGFVPDGASNLKELSENERKVIFEREFQSALNDPVIDDIVKKVAPNGSNLQKAKAGVILSSFAEHGRYIPDQYMPLLDRFRGLEDPKFVSNELKTWAYQNTGKMPSEITPSDVANARKSMDNHHFVQAQLDAYYRSKGTTKAQYEDELSKPISAEDRAEQGIGSKIKTYAELADEGKRFASDADRKMYQELYTARSRLERMKDMLFNKKDGVFTGIERSKLGRGAGKGRLVWEKWNGTQRGINTEEYENYMAYFARSLIKIAGESGSRLSDQDIQGIIAAMSDTGQGFDVPDSEALARSKYDHALMDMAKLMRLLEDTTTALPTGQPTQPTQPTTYEVNKTYTDAEGRKAKYLGEKEGKAQWQIQP